LPKLELQIVDFVRKFILFNIQELKPTIIKSKLFFIIKQDIAKCSLMTNYQ